MKTEIVYEDNDILVCYKPAGIPTQTKQTMQMDVESELRNYLKGKPIYVIHRLDQPVEGLLVFGKSKIAASTLGKQLNSDEINKEYYAVVFGMMEQKKGTLINYMKKENKGNLSRIVSKADTDGKYAELSYEVVGEYKIKGISLLRIHLKTGRHHQIRVQLAGANHSLLGDQKYGDFTTQELSKQLGIRNVALCAARLHFNHPTKKKEMEFEISPKGLPFQFFRDLLCK